MIFLRHTLRRLLEAGLMRSLFRFCSPAQNFTWSEVQAVSG
jgi:hypothetical protein